MSTKDEANYNYLLDNDEFSYLQRKPFKAYADLVEQAVHALAEPVCTRQIHEFLGDNARREWTLDALESLKTVAKLPGLIDRWQRVCGTGPKLATFIGESKNPSWIFAGPKQIEREQQYKGPKRPKRQGKPKPETDCRERAIRAWKTRRNNLEIRKRAIQAAQQKQFV